MFLQHRIMKGPKEVQGRRYDQGRIERQCDGRDNYGGPPLEIMASMSDTDPKIYGNTTGKVSVEKIARTARLMEVRVSLSLGDCIIFYPLLFLYSK